MGGVTGFSGSLRLFGQPVLSVQTGPRRFLDNDRADPHAAISWGYDVVDEGELRPNLQGVIMREKRLLNRDLNSLS